MTDPKNVFHISTLSIVKVILILLLLAFLWIIRDVIGLVFVAFILAAAFDPAVDWMQRRKIPRGIGVLIIFLSIISVLSSIIYMASGPIVEQVSALAANFPQYYSNIMDAWNQFQSLGGGTTSLNGTISSLPTIPQATSGLFSFVSGLFGSIFAFFLVLVMTFYFTVQEENMRTFFRSIAPDKYGPYVMQLMTRVQHKLGQWLRGWLVLSFIVFLMVYLILTILGIKYALVLALLAGAFEIIPFLGPILAAIPAIFLAFQQSVWLAVGTIIAYLVVQQIENNIVVPKIMGKITGLNPIVILIVILVGAKVGGIVGALLAVPVATAISVYVKDFSDKKVG